MQLIENASNEKLRGAYYTPREIASFILRWGMDGNPCANILEPSCGDGAFLKCIHDEKLAYKSIVAVEYDEAEAQKAAMIPLSRMEVLNGDFHQFCLNQGKRFDLVVGNPPFIRYQYYKQEQQALADEIFRKVGLKRSKLTNAWVSFVVGCAQLLSDNGKLGFVVPSEILQVSYAKQLRKYLAECFNKINIISFENLVFAEIQQDVVLLLCEKDNTGNHLIDHIELKDSTQLAALSLDKLSKPTKAIDFHSDKWTYYFLDNEELALINKAKGMEGKVIADYADVEVGITTGANNFFTVPESIVNAYQLQDFARPMVGRSVQVNSLRFTKDDWRKNVAAQAKAYMLVFTPDAKQTGNDGVKAYLENGEKEGINRGYKTGIRDDWYVIPSIKLSEALFLRRNYMYPKFVLNEAKAYTTDTMHRVFIHEGVNAKAFIASYYNSLSFAFAEILGRNYGGGCLELMPSEASHVFIPYDVRNEDLFDTIDTMLRQNKSADEILDVTDNVLLHERLGFTSQEISLARSIWHKIMGKRLNRQQVKTIEPKKTDKGKAIVKQLDMFETLKRYRTNLS